MQSRIRNILVTVVVPFIGVGCSDSASFSQDVMPILTAHCIQCHDGSSEGSAASGFSVKTYESVMKGTRFGPVVVAGSSVSSSLYRMIAHKVDPKIQMPPHHDEGLAAGRDDALSDKQVATIEQWIDQGAKNN